MKNVCFEPEGETACGNGPGDNAILRHPFINNKEQPRFALLGAPDFKGMVLYKEYHYFRDFTFSSVTGSLPYSPMPKCLYLDSRSPR